jgi:hypothetical protein
VHSFSQVLNEIRAHGQPVLNELEVDDGKADYNPNKEICEYFYEMFNKLNQKQSLSNERI